MNGSVRIALARRRAGSLLSELSPNQSAQQQKRLILDQSCSYLPGLGYGGPAFDLEILLEDPSFRLPGRSRSETERIVAEGTRESVTQLGLFAKEESRRRWGRILRINLWTIALGTAVFALPNMPRIASFLHSLVEMATQ